MNDSYTEKQDVVAFTGKKTKGGPANVASMIEFVGPIAQYKKHSRMQIWENVPVHPLFQDPVFVKLEKNSDQIDWVNGRYAIEQSDLMNGIGDDQDANGADQEKKKGADDEDDVFIKVYFQLPILLLKGKKSNLQIRDEVEEYLGGEDGYFMNAVSRFQTI